MQKDLLPVESLDLVFAEATHDEVLHMGSRFDFEFDLPAVDFFLEALQSLLLEMPRDPPNNHFISHHPQRPDIALIGVSFFVEYLRRHVGRSAHNGVEEAVVFGMLGEAEVSDFEDVVFDEYVLGFEISMRDSVFGELSKTIQYLDQVLHGLLLFEFALFEDLSQGASLRQLQHYVEIVDGLVHIVKPDDVGAFEFFVDLYFGIEGSLGIFVLVDFGFGDYLDRNFLLGFLIKTFVDLRKGAFPKFLAEEYDVLSDSFLGIVVHF